MVNWGHLGDQLGGLDELDHSRHFLHTFLDSPACLLFVCLNLENLLKKNFVVGMWMKMGGGRKGRMNMKEEK